MVESIPYFGDELATAAMAGMNSVDGGRDQRLEAAVDGGNDLGTLEAERAMRGRRGLEKVSKFLPVRIYSPTLSV